MAVLNPQSTDACCQSKCRAYYGSDRHACSTSEGRREQPQFSSYCCAVAKANQKSPLKAKRRVHRGGGCILELCIEAEAMQVSGGLASGPSCRAAEHPHARQEISPTLMVSPSAFFVGSALACDIKLDCLADVEFRGAFHITLVWDDDCRCMTTPRSF